MKHDLKLKEEGSFLGKLLGYLDYVFHYIRLYTIPPGDEEEYDHKYTILWPIFGIPTILILLF